MGILTKKEVLSKLSNKESFKDCVIRDLDFSSHPFNDFVDFSGAYFTGEVSFRGATFKKGANFYNVTFSKGADFREVTTTETINLEHSQLANSRFDFEVDIDLNSLTNKKFYFNKNNERFAIDKKTGKEYVIINPNLPALKIKIP